LILHHPDIALPTRKKRLADLRIEFKRPNIAKHFPDHREVIQMCKTEGIESAHNAVLNGRGARWGLTNIWPQFAFNSSLLWFGSDFFVFAPSDVVEDVVEFSLKIRRELSLGW